MDISMSWWFYSLLTEWRRDPLGAVEQGELDRLENGENPVNILDLEYTGDSYT